MRYGRQGLRVLGFVLLASALSYPLWGQADNVKNRFEPCVGGASTPCDNKLSIDGTIQRKETVGGTSVSLALTTTGIVTLDGSNPTSVEMNPLATIDACALTIEGSGTPGDDPVAVTAVTTATAGQLDIYAWKTDGADPTLTASTNNNRIVHYVCGGS